MKSILQCGIMLSRNELLTSNTGGMNTIYSGAFFWHRNHTFDRLSTTPHV